MFEITSYRLYEGPQLSDLSFLSLYNSRCDMDMVNYVLKEKVLSYLRFLPNLVRLSEPETKNYLLIK